MGQMKSALAVYRADEQTLRGFADKLIWRMNKAVADMSPDNFQYERTKDWVNFSKIWVEQNCGRITEEIG